MPDIGNPFFGAFVAVLEGAARRDGYELMIVSSGDDPVQEAARLRTLLTWRPAGVIAIPCRNDIAGSEVAAAAGVPLVVADRIPATVTTDVVGVNNRNLRTLHTDLGVSRRLAPLVTGAPAAVVESGLRTRVEIDELSALGYKGFLIGGSFMKAPEPGPALAALIAS